MVFKSAGRVWIPNDLSLTDFVLRDASQHGDRCAVVCSVSGQSVKYSDMFSQIRSVGAALTKLGLSKGDVVAIYSPNTPLFGVAFHGILNIGLVATTCNPLYTAAELAHQLHDSSAKVIITVNAFVTKAQDAATQCGIAADKIFTFDAPVSVQPHDDTDTDDNKGLARPFAELLAADPSACPCVAIDPRRDTCVIPYSSGTSGLPKGVVLTHYNLVANLCQTIPHVNWDQDDTLIGVLPFFHIYGMVIILNAALLLGCKVVSMPRFVPDQFLKVIQDHKVTVAHVVPPIVLFLAKHPLVDQFDISSLREITSGAAPLGKQLTSEAMQRTGAVIRQGYGMTELSPVAAYSPIHQIVAGSCGTLLASTECKIISTEDGKEQLVGGEGELLFRGPQVMSGYRNNPEATARTIDSEGFLHSGDVGYIDAHGNLFIVDRVKELIKFKGFQVAPAELEALLQSHPQVADVAVIGKPDIASGEQVYAFIVRRPQPTEGAGDDEISMADIQAWVAGQVAPHKKIRGGEFCTQIPKSASGKILRRVLRDQLKARLQAQGEL